MHTAPAIVPTTHSTVIDMYTPAEAGAVLHLDDNSLLDLVNRGDLAAYRFGPAIRFRVCDVQAIAALLVAA